MNEDPRCCGSGTCIIDTEGRCWCGQQWDGQTMSHAPPTSAEDRGRTDEGPPPCPMARADRSSELPAFSHREVRMTLFNPLPGFERSAPGLEPRI